MMYYIESDSYDPAFNLALEQYIFDCLDPENDYFMLWQNDNTIVVGKHQNTIAEINAAYVKERNINVVRRLSGGGAVYHDLGNINFTFIAKTGKEGTFDFATFCRPVVKALDHIGVHAEINGRNDITLNGKKFSGNSQYMKHGRVMHHGTIMYDSDLSVVSAALTPPKDKLESKGLKSVASRVTNVRPYVPDQITTIDFLQTLKAFMFREYDLRPLALTQSQLQEISDLRNNRYATWEWNYGQSPRYTHIKERRVEGCGNLQLYLDVESGVIRGIEIYGDFFGSEDVAQLSSYLIGCLLEESVLLQKISQINLPQYIQGITAEQFVTVLLQ